MKQNLLLIQIRDRMGSSREEIIRVASLLYASEFLTEEECKLVIDLMNERIYDIKACKPK